MKTLWVVTELYYPEETSTGYYLTRIAEGLADKFKVKVLCGQPNYSAKGARAPAKENHNNVEISRCSSTTLDKNVIAFRLINMLTLGLSTFFAALVGFKKGDDVLVVTTPPSMPFIVALAAKVKGATYVPLIHDNYPDLAIASKKLRPDSFVAKISVPLNRRLLAGARKIIVVGRDMRELVAQKKAGAETPIAMIPNWAESDDLKPAPREQNTLLRELGITDKFIMLYAGNMGHPNDMESIVECAKRLKNDDRFHFLFLGSGVKRKWLEREISENEIGNATLLDPRPRSQQNIFLNACDAAIISLVSGMWGVSMPSRTYNTLAVGKPIIALTEAGSELAQVVEEDKVGWVAPPGDPDLLLKTIEQAWQSRAQLPEMGSRARQAALEKYSLETAVTAYYRELS
jgi:glycosyltransferase involved in cell wall biosynthesis